MLKASITFSIILLAVACEDRPLGDEGSTARTEPTPTRPLPTTPVPAPPAPAMPTTPMPGAPGAMPGTTPGTGTDTQARLDGGQIIKTLDVIHDAEIEQARLAKQRGNNPRVKQFADQMIREHTQAMEKGTTLARRINAQMTDSDVSRQIEQELRANTDRLRNLQGAELDRQYVTMQVDEHRAALGHLDRFRAMTDNADVRAHIEEMRTAVQAHLQHAQELRGVVASR
jgi:putative membrane protein